MKLKVVQPYRCRDVVYAVGAVLDLSDEETRWLMADAPGCFEVVPKRKPRKAKPKELDKPPADKAVKRGRGRARTK